jgi:hypothetical protein
MYDLYPDLTARFCIFIGIREEVADNLLKPRRIAKYPYCFFRNTDSQPMFTLLEQWISRLHGIANGASNV